MTDDEIKQDMVAACRDFKKHGYELVDRTFTIGGKDRCGGCALVAVAVERCGLSIDMDLVRDMIPAVKKRYGWDGGIAAFTDGFDDRHPASDCNRNLFELGLAVRKALRLRSRAITSR